MKFNTIISTITPENCVENPAQLCNHMCDSCWWRYKPTENPYNITPKWQLCPVCGGIGTVDRGLTVRSDCKTCNGKKIIHVDTGNPPL